MLSNKKFSSRSMCVLAETVLLLALLLASGCSKSDDKEVESPDIALNKNELVLEKGKTERLIASFTPGDASDKGHTWSSSVPGVATVDETGMVTAVELGEAVITTTSLVGKKTATCKVTVVDKVVNVTGVSVNPIDTTMVVGDDVTLEATVIPDNATNKAVAWSSEDNSIATVDRDGKVTAVAEGKVAIKATTNNGSKTASSQITVLNKGVIISAPEVSAVTSISALVTGTAKAFGVKISEVGICYSTTPSPTIDDKKVPLSGESLSYTLTKLEANTTYYVRIYAITDGSAKYGDQAMFATKTTVDISIPQITSVSTFTAYIQGTITTYGLQTEEIGICYSISPMPTIADTKVILSNNNIAYTLNDLQPETTYYVRIFAKLNGDYYYGETGEFTTTGIIKTHFEATDIYEDKIILISAAPSGITTINVCYGTSPNPKITDNTTTASLESDGKLHLELTALKPGTTYYIRPYNRIESKVEYFDDEVFIQTIGGDFSIDLKINGCEKDMSEMYTTRYKLYLEIVYDIKITGTYLVEAVGDNSYLKKNTDYSKSIYLENGRGSFYFRKDGGWKEFNGIGAYYLVFPYETDLKFTNIDDDIRYHYILKEKGLYYFD